MDADTIVVLDRGLVAEVGTHAQLLQTAGLYAAMSGGGSARSKTLACLEVKHQSEHSDDIRATQRSGLATLR